MMRWSMRTTMRWPTMALLAAGAALAPACSDDTTATPDAGVDAALVDGGPGDGAPADAGEPTLAPRTDPTAVTPGQWMVAWVGSSNDPVYAALEQGTFTYPKPGWDGNKVHWSLRKTDKNGGLGSFPAGYGYAAAKLTVAKPGRIFVRAGPSYGVWVNGRRHPADVYGSRRVWVPLHADVGENLVVVRIRGGVGKPQAELWTTPDELVFNLKDTSLPHLLVGDTATQCLGVPVLNLTGAAIANLQATVVGDASFKETTVTIPSIGPTAVTQVAFRLEPRQAVTQAKQKLTVKLRLRAAGLKHYYERELELESVGPDTPYRRTRVSTADGSCQFYGVLPPSNLDPKQTYGLALSLHGAGVNAYNQAKSYSQKDWAYIVAPTNRRRFGFDWELWGRLDALEALDHASQTFNIDPTRVHVTGHSMGGHGTWHLGVTTPGRFGVIAPSAGWSSFYSYGGSARPSGAFARSQAHSDTNVYLSNLARRSIYILHGGADNNVPTSEGQAMYKEAQKHCKDVTYHEEPGKGHWWDDSYAKGVDCVDWPAIFAKMKATTVDPTELEFDFKTPSPWYSPTHSYVTIRSQTDPGKDSTLSSKASGATVTLTTTNVRSMTLDGTALTAKGITTAVVDGTSVNVTSGEIAVGPQGGKRHDLMGPFNQTMHRPFCLVYADSGAAAPRFREIASYLVSSWAVIGNGHACSMPLSRFKAAPPKERNIIFLGVPSADVDKTTLPFSWSASSIQLGQDSYSAGALVFVVPRDGRPAGVMYATPGSEHLLLRVTPFSSRFVFPDYMLWSSKGLHAAGFFDATWAYTGGS